MIHIFVHQNGRTTTAGQIDPAWLAPDSGVILWVDLVKPGPEEARVLTDVFHFHELAVEDSLSEIHHPKVELYDGYLYLILHGIDFQASQHRFTTHDIDFFLGPNYLVTVHDGKSRSVEELRHLCGRTGHILAEGAAALMHRIIDSMIDNYRPEVEKLEHRLDLVERAVFEQRGNHIVQSILNLKRDVASLRRVTLPQRDVLSRLARREFALISEAMSYRFRDVHDHLVRLADESLFFHDRITGILDAHLAAVSNRLNEVVKVLAVIATGLMPLTVITGAWGMNVQLPRFPGGDAAQFWWVMVIMVTMLVVLIWYFKHRRFL